MPFAYLPPAILPAGNGKRQMRKTTNERAAPIALPSKIDQ
jgi:hypothetical protein